MNTERTKNCKPLRGRPKINNGNGFQDCYFENQEEFLADDQQCEKLIFLFATLASYKIRVKTGPNEQFAENDELEKYEIRKQQNQAFADSQILKKEYFFVSNQKKNFDFVNNKLVDKTVYQFIDDFYFQPQLQNLIAKLNRVVKLLDIEFVNILEIILQIYQNSLNIYSDEVFIVDQIVSHIRNPDNFEQFQYLLLWEQLRNISRQARFKGAEAELNKEILKLSKKTSQKVINKQKQFIEKQEKQILEENFMEPIRYLITKLVQIFNEIIFNN